VIARADPNFTFLATIVKTPDLFSISSE